MKKTIITLSILFFITSAIAQSGNMVSLKIVTGSDDLRRNSSAFIRLNLTDGTSTPEMPIYRSGGSLSGGFPQGSSRNITVNLPRTIDLTDIRSFTIRHDGSPREAFDTYDNWDLQSLQVNLSQRIGMRTWSFGIFNSSDRTFVTRFTGSNRILNLDKQR